MIPQSEPEAVEELLPCPFCQTTAFGWARPDGDTAVTCRQCGAIGPIEDSDHDAVAAWNHRLANSTASDDGLREKRATAQFVADELDKYLRERNGSRAEALLFVNRHIVHEALIAFAKADAILALLPDRARGRLEGLEEAAKDFRHRANVCRTNLDAYDDKAAAIWDWAADAVEEKL